MYFLKVSYRVTEKSVKYKSSKEIKIQAFRFDKGDDNWIHIVGLMDGSILLDEKTKVNVKKNLLFQK